MQVIELIGRIFLSLIFLLGGIGKIYNQEGTIGYMESFGVPGELLIPAIITEILFPILIIIGYKTKISALILAFTAILFAAIFHSDFSNQMEIMAFMKDLAISGGFLIIFFHGPGKYTLDRLLSTGGFPQSFK
jgi:putative oxidoreductase